MITITERQWQLLPAEKKGFWRDIAGLRPDWRGRRVLLVNSDQKERTRLAIEGVNFEIVAAQEPETQGRANSTERPAARPGEAAR